MARSLGPLFAEYVRTGGPEVVAVLADALLEAGREPLTDDHPGGDEALIRVLLAHERLLAVDRVTTACLAVGIALDRHGAGFRWRHELAGLLARAAAAGPEPLADRATADRKAAFALWRRTTETPLARITYAVWEIYRDLPNLALNGALQLADVDGVLATTIERIAGALERCG